MHRIASFILFALLAATAALAQDQGPAFNELEPIIGMEDGRTRPALESLLVQADIVTDRATDAGNEVYCEALGHVLGRQVLAIGSDPDRAVLFSRLRLYTSSIIIYREVLLDMRGLCVAAYARGIYGMSALFVDVPIRDIFDGSILDGPGPVDTPPGPFRAPAQDVQPPAPPTRASDVSADTAARPPAGPSPGAGQQGQPPYLRTGNVVLLYGLPACWWETEVIVTSGGEKPDGTTEVYAPNVQDRDFYVQMRDPTTGLIARYEGQFALDILLVKGYFRDVGGGRYQGTAAYDDFVVYSAPGGGSDAVAFCDGVIPDPSPRVASDRDAEGVISLDGTYVWRGDYPTYSGDTLTSEIRVTVSGNRVSITHRYVGGGEFVDFKVELTGGQFEQTGTDIATLAGGPISGEVYDRRDESTRHFTGSYWRFGTTDGGRTFGLTWGETTLPDVGGYYVFGPSGNEFQHGAIPGTARTEISR